MAFTIVLPTACGPQSNQLPEKQCFESTPPMLARILVPLDGSRCAEHALQYAVGLAKAEAAKLYIYALVDPIAVLGRNPANPLEDEHIAAAKAEAERFVKLAVANAISSGLRAEGYVELGEPTNKIVAHATEIEADTIVMGTHGCSGFRRFFMGSIAEKILRSAPCPVVVVREKAAVERVAAPVVTRDSTAPVFSFRLIEVSSDDFERLYGEIASFMDGPGANLPGMVDAQLFGSIEATRIMILAQFRSHQDWVHAQWDVQLGELLEEIAANSQTLEFNLYRGDHFLARLPTEQAIELGTQGCDASSLTKEFVRETHVATRLPASFNAALL